MEEREIQAEYYRRTAENYDEAHLEADPEHGMALAFMAGAIRELGVESVLDVGSGTGRVLGYLDRVLPQVRSLGVEPVEALRKIGHEKGIAPDRLVDGDATRLDHADGSFDLVCEYAVLHHVADPTQVVTEMLRVARRGIFISDANRYGQGRPLARGVKQALSALGLWPMANLIKTRGKGYIITEGDGLSYSYSVFDNYDLVQKNCRQVHLLNTAPGGINPYRTAPHVALLGIK
jgi:SAM-dependent methyltransferase